MANYFGGKWPIQQKYILKNYMKLNDIALILNVCINKTSG